MVLLLFRDGGPIDPETTAVKKIVDYTHRCQEREDMSCHGGPHGESLEPAMRQRERGELWRSSFCVVSMEKKS